MSKKSSSSRMRTSESALSTSASAVGLPYFASRSFSSDPAFTPIRISTPRSFASRAMRRTLSWYLMLPGLMRRPWMPPSSAAIAYFHWKWMSAITGIVACSAIVFSAFASSQWGTATRTISHPAATRAAICCSVAFTSAVFVVHIDWTRMGASPPTSTHPTRTFLETRRETLMLIPVWLALLPEDVEEDLALLRLVELDQDEPLPLPEQGLAPGDGDGVRGGAQQHLGHVRAAVGTLVALLEVLRAPREVVVRVVDLARDQFADAPAKVVEGALLPLIDEQGAGGVGAERHGAALGDARVLDRAPKVVGEIDGGEP